MESQAKATELVGAGAQLKNYTLAKQDVADAIRAAKHALEARGAANEVEQSQALLVKLAEDRFNLAVVGQFKRGKSSLMNAVIGRDLLPTGVLPLTSAITTLCYGSEERVLLKRKGWAFDQEIPLGELAEYVTEQGNPGNEKGVLEARVVVAVPFLRRGLHFIDTPGVGSARRENTATTYAFLPEADAVIFVTSVEAPLSEAEQQFLWDIRQHAHKVFVVVNKMDMLAPPERERVLGYIGAGIARTLAVNDVRVLPLSARQGLAGKLSRDRAGIRASGLEAFEEILAEFLGAEKERTFLVAILDRARQLLSVGSPESAAVCARIASMRARLLAGETPAGGLRTGETVDRHLLERAVAVDRARRPRRDEAARTGACRVCAAQADTLFNVLAKWQYVLATDEASRRAFALTRGFCPIHTWQFQQVASPQGISEGYAPLIEAVCSEVRQALEQTPEDAAARILALLPTTATCPACRVLREVEDERLQQVLRQLGAMDAEPPDAPSPALCLPHLGAELARAPSAQTTAFLLREQARRLEELSEDLRSYALKREALRRGLLNANEESAWRRALAALVGERAGRGL